jgi:membrane-associated HD superfamily phosphohydrolase
MKDKKIGKWCVFVVLFLLLIGRIVVSDEQSKWIQGIGFIGVVVALVDLYANTYKQNHQKDKFKVIIGLAVIIATLLMIIAVGMIMNIIVLQSRGNDVLTILSLLISLPSELYCDWIKKYVDNV